MHKLDTIIGDVMADLQKLEIARWLDKIARLEKELEVYRTVVLPALEEAAEFLGHWGFKNERVEHALRVASE